MAEIDLVAEKLAKAYIQSGGAGEMPRQHLKNHLALSLERYLEFGEQMEELYEQVKLHLQNGELNQAMQCFGSMALLSESEGAFRSQNVSPGDTF